MFDEAGQLNADRIIRDLPMPKAQMHSAILVEHWVKKLMQ